MPQPLAFSEHSCYYNECGAVKPVEETAGVRTLNKDSVSTVKGSRCYYPEGMMNCDTTVCTTTANVYRGFSSKSKATREMAAASQCCDEKSAAAAANCCIKTPLLWNEILFHHIDG